MFCFYRYIKFSTPAFSLRYLEFISKFCHCNWCFFCIQIENLHIKYMNGNALYISYKTSFLSLILSSFFSLFFFLFLYFLFCSVESLSASCLKKALKWADWPYISVSFTHINKAQMITKRDACRDILLLSSLLSPSYLLRCISSCCPPTLSLHCFRLLQVK